MILQALEGFRPLEAGLSDPDVFPLRQLERRLFAPGVSGFATAMARSPQRSRGAALRPDRRLAEEALEARPGPFFLERFPAPM